MKRIKHEMKLDGGGEKIFERREKMFDDWYAP